ncbi:MAG: Kelch repeat-containing protein, partial [Acidimicrobiales bacterium]
PGPRPGPRARPSGPGRLPPGVYRRRRLTVVGVAVAGVVAIAVFATGGGSGRKDPAGATASKAKQSGPPQLVASMASWQLPEPLSRTVALPVGGSIVVLGGLTGTGNATTADITRIDPVSGRSQTVGSLPAAVHDAAGAVLGSRYLVFGGGAADVTSAVQAYSPDTPAGQPPASVVGQLPSRRADLASATAPDGRVYLAGGYDGTAWAPEVLETRDGKSFSVVGRLRVPVRYPAVAVAAGKVWIVGGATGAGGDTNAIQTIDLNTHEIAVSGHLPTALAHASAAEIGGTIYLFGGRSGSIALDGVWRLDTATASFTQVGTIPVPTSDMSAAVMGETVYLVGGEGQTGQPGRGVVVARLVSGSPAPAAGTAAPPFKGKLLIADYSHPDLLASDGTTPTHPRTG